MQCKKYHIRQGTTPTHTFKLPFDPASLKILRLYYRQNYTTLITKDKADFVIDGDNASIKLTQEETLMFDIDAPAEMQLRTLGYDGTAGGTIIYKLGILPVLEPEVLE